MDEPTWIDDFLSQEGNEFFVKVDPDFIRDRFNLTGITVQGARMHEVEQHVLGEAFESDSEFDEENGMLAFESTCRHFYGLIHARYIMEARGLQKMLAKYLNGDFGKCPRALCRLQPVLPIGLHDRPDQSGVKLYCPKCEDVYHPTNPKHAVLDGAYFGTSFPAMLFQSYPRHIPRKTTEQFVLKLFGFKLHDHAELARWQQRRREEMEKKLRQTEV